jgi:hypothetical protein
LPIEDLVSATRLVLDQGGHNFKIYNNGLEVAGSSLEYLERRI